MLLVLLAYQAPFVRFFCTLVSRWVLRSASSCALSRADDLGDAPIGCLQTQLLSLGFTCSLGAVVSALLSGLTVAASVASANSKRLSSLGDVPSAPPSSNSSGTGDP